MNIGLEKGRKNRPGQYFLNHNAKSLCENFKKATVPAGTLLEH